MSVNNRILIVDDTPSIHEDFRKILMSSDSVSKDLQQVADSLFGDSGEGPLNKCMEYEIHSAYQGEEALQMIEKAEQEGKGYALIFMDVRMPPGLDGVKTIKKIWQQYPCMEIVICTAYSDYSWSDIVDMLGPSDHLLVLKKPFDADEAQQMALSLTRRAGNAKKQRQHLSALQQNLDNCYQSVDQLKQQIEKIQ
jgi:CheY-like chemotaxis protein